MHAETRTGISSLDQWVPDSLRLPGWRVSLSPRPVAGLVIVKERACRDDRCAIALGAVARTLAGSAWKDGRPFSRSSW